ncbi:MAG: helicase-associated domain-containing protein [Anaerolineae bacterium]
MPTLESLTEDDIQEYFSDSAYRKAHDLVPMVRNPERIRDSLRAQVQGADLYTVAIDVTRGGIVATCTCPYEWEGHCKHIGAVLLKWIYQPQTFALGASSPDDATLTAGQPQQLPGWMRVPATEREKLYRQYLEDSLDLFRLNELRDMAKTRGWVVRGTRKADVAAAIAEQMVNPAGIAQRVEQLGKPAKAALRAAALVGDFPGQREADVFRVAHLWAPAESDPALAHHIDRLSAQGLVFPADTYGPDGPLAPYIPESLARWYPRLLADVIPQRATLPSDAAGSEQRLANPVPFLRSTLAVLSALDALQPPLRQRPINYAFEAAHPFLRGWDYDQADIERLEKQGLITRFSRAAVKVPPPGPLLSDEFMARLAPIAGGADRLAFIYAVLRSAGVLLPGSPVRPWEEVKVAFLKRDEAEQHTILSRAYIVADGCLELWPVLRADSDLALMRLLYANYSGPVTPQSLRTEVAIGRHLVLRVLAYLPDDAWIRLDDLFAVLRVVWREFNQGFWLRYRGGGEQTGAWYVARDGAPLAAKSDLDWRRGQGAFIREMLTGPLHWLGLVDLAVSGRDVTHVRFHGLADILWGRSDAVLGATFATAPSAAANAAPANAVSVDGDVIRLDPVAGAAAHGMLERIAHLERAQPYEFVYRLDPAAVHRLFESGTDADRIGAEWAAAFGAAIPAAIHDRLSGWWQTYGSVRLYQNATVIEFSDDYALAEMKAITSLAKVLIAEVSPRLVIIPREAADTLAAELTKAGYTPQRADGNA